MTESMKTVILAGGRGTRLAEETAIRPKPMVEVGGKPLLWHIMGIYADYGYRRFVVACGYKGEIIKEYFANLLLHTSDWTINLRDGTRQIVNSATPDWVVELVDTGMETGTAGRLRRLRDRLDTHRFMVTYGDGVADVDVAALVAFHQQHGCVATVTAVRPPARFGGLELDGDRVERFTEKPQAGGGWINGGFFVFEPQVFDYFASDEEHLERTPLERLTADGQLMAFRHEGFWQPMDTLRERTLLEDLWRSGSAPWRRRR